MLIVNADDLGRSRDETEATLNCYSRGGLTSTSAMVFMTDSERAAERTRKVAIPVGIHINLSESFSSDAVPVGLRQRHERIRRFLTRSKYALIAFHPLLTRDFQVVVEAQFAEFRRLYDREPAHVDGHQHMHLATNVLWQRLLPAGVRVRRSFSFSRGQKGAINRLYRSTIDRALSLRHPVTDHFFALSSCMVDDRLEHVIRLASAGDVEIMTHAIRKPEFDLLTCARFARQAADVLVRAGGTEGLLSQRVSW